MIFKLYECDFGFTYNGVNYDFEHVEDLTFDNPERTKLVRGGNAANKTGIVYKEGIKDPKTFTVTIIGMTAAIHNLLKEAYKNKTRLDVYTVHRPTGSSKIGKNAILSQEPMQLAINDGVDSMNTAIEFQSYDVEEIHKE